ncbi:UNVERIFIED_CONTAM: hypothetical protein Slati_3089500 [Sesamum latifolium]|uniref:Retrotransposon gag protein n=1 Tax=Sesamum latifolium TaxID=2727402 RepID=A0AAW2UU70_9LAMI
MCIQGMHWRLLYILQRIKLRNIEELATRAHDMELSIANHKTVFSVDDQRKDKKDLKRSEKFTKPNTKESMAINTAPIKISSNDRKKPEKPEDQRVTNDRRRPILKELQEKEYPFPDSDVPYIFDELLERKLIELPESKHPDEAGRVNDPKYCKYHRVVSHPIERCFVFKEKIMALAKEGKIILDVEETVGTNVAGITAANNRHVLEGKQEVKQSSTTTLSTFQFGSFEPIQIEALFVNEEKEISAEDDDRWTLVTRRQRQRWKVDKFHPSLPRKPRLHKQPYHAKAINKIETITRQRLPVTLEEFFPQTFFERKDKAVSASPRTNRRRPLVSCCATLSFTDEDLLLGSKPHNRPLFVLGFIQEQRVNRILIDGGSAVNIMPKTTMKKMGITSEDLSRSRLTIQGFDQGTQRAVGMTWLDLTVGELKASTLFHVIDARTSYNLLLGRPWLHENGVVPSTLHQCFKYIKNGEIVKVDADIEEVYPKAPIENNNEKLSETAKDEAPTNGKYEAKKSPYSPVFRYVVRSNNKEKKNQPKDHVPLLFKERKQLKEAKVRDLQEIKAELVIPITSLHPLISSFIPDEPIKISVRKERKYATVQHISADNGKSDENQKPNDIRISVFKRLGTPTARASIFERLGEASKDSSNNTRRRQRGSVFYRLGDGHAQQFRKKGRYDETNGHKNSNISATLHLSRPQGGKTSLLIVSSGGPIKVKQHVAGKPHGSSETLNEEEIEIIVGSNHVSIDEGSNSDISENEIQNAPAELEDGVQATVDELKELNLGTIEEPRPIFVSALPSPKEEEQYFKTLGEYKDVFAWTYKEMPGLDPKVAIHHLGIRYGARPVKQSQRVLRPDLIPRIETEVNKLIDAGFIRKVKYPTWISSIVPVKKKNGQIRICVDFRDLNKACPKDDFPLPIIELMVDATTGHEASP